MLNSSHLPAGQMLFQGLDRGDARLAGGDADRSLGRLLDLCGAIALIVFIAPLMVVLWVIGLVQDGASPIFAQTRMGEGGRPFRCYKFRTMVPNAEARLRELLNSDSEARAEWMRDQKLRRDPRVTPVGRFLRKTSLDELPQLFNVLRGDMSLVGPRPIVKDEIGRYGRHFRDYCRVKPGLTGLWQVSGRNDIAYRKRVAMDVLYCRNKSVKLDLGILLMTVPAVLFSRGTY